MYKNLVILLLYSVGVYGISSEIPQQLLHCYKVENEREHRHSPPFVVRTLTELIRKLEHNRTEPNIRFLSNAILNVVKLDGVQHASVTSNPNNARLSLATPFRAAGPQFFKHSHLLDHLSSNFSSEFPPVLNNDELCLLHFMVSDTVDKRLRNDESTTCSISFRNIESKIERLIDEGTFVKKEIPLSDCPELKGVMYTKWGSVSVGPLIAGIATSFAPTTDPDDVWMATLGGVLAHVVINQATENPVLLTVGKWNDTILPRKYFLTGNFWDVNDALLLGAIDGLILSSEMKNWFHSNPAASLSQVIASYYSPRGVPYDRSVRACNRAANLAKLFNRYDFVKEVSSVTKQLNNVGTYLYSLDDQRVDVLVNATVERFKMAADSLIPNLKDCDSSTNEKHRHLEVIVIADQTYTPYQMEMILSHLTDVADISFYSSRIGVISGSSGRWLVNITSDILEVYSEMSKINNNDWPTGLTLTPCLHTIIADYQNISSVPCTRYARPHGKAIVILAQSTYLTDGDLASARQSLDSLRGTYPETRVIIASDPEHAKAFESLLRADDAKTKMVATFNLRESIVKIGKHLAEVPATIIDVYCNGSTAEFEDYVTPGADAVYEIGEEYMPLKDITINIRSRGDLHACAYGAATPLARQCHLVGPQSEVTFRASDHCQTGTAGTATDCSLRLLVTTNNTRPSCTEFACRYPDQVLINIRTSWTNASPTRQSTSWSMLLLSAMFVNALSNL